MRPNVAKNLQSFCHDRTLNDGNFNWIECAIDGSAILGKMRSKGQGHDRTKHGGDIHVDGFLSSMLVCTYSLTKCIHQLLSVVVAVSVATKRWSV